MIAGDILLTVTTGTGRTGPAGVPSVWRRILAAVLLLAGSFVVSGCGLVFGTCRSPNSQRPDDIQVSDLEGTYGSARAGTLTLLADGSFTAVDLTNASLDETRLSRPGTWTLQPTNDTRSGDITLLFDMADGTKYSWDLIYIAGTRAQPRLFLFDGPNTCETISMPRTK
jgi:hypothetical protein